MHILQIEKEIRIQRTGNNRIDVTSTDRPLTSEEAAEIQTAAGYMPAGYGMSPLTTRQKEDGSYLTFWYFSRSCD